MCHNVMRCAIFLLVLTLSSIGYSSQGTAIVFPVFHVAGAVFSGKGIDAVKPLNGELSRPLTMRRAQGVVVPACAGQKLEAVVGFIHSRTSAEDAVFTYPDLGFL